MKQISILGLGWLGEPLAQRLIQEGYQVNGTVSSQEKANKLLQTGINATCFKLAQSEWKITLSSVLKGARCLLITIPPSANKEQYAKLLIEIVQFIEQKFPKLQLIYTSSISVYGNQQGEVDEHSPAAPESSNAKQIHLIEQFLFQSNLQTRVVRLGGLVGPNRHPVNYLAGREGLTAAKKPVNLVHLQDVIKVMQALIQNKKKIRLVNLVSPVHPTKKSFYQSVANNLKLKLPIFDASDSTKGKIVNSIVLKKFNYNFEYPNPASYPESLVSK